VLTEGENISGTQRNAVSETLRRLLRRGAVQRDDKSRPVRYRAVSAALRELLLSGQ
jgi:sugar-specific transcriptional regulator TrmB